MSAQPPPQEFIDAVGPALQDFISRANALFGLAGVAGVNSWWRSLQANFREGGASCSQHLFALAADLQTNEQTSAVLAAAPRVGLVASPISATAVHIQYYPRGTLSQLGVCPDPRGLA